MDPVIQYAVFAGLAVFFTGLAWNRQKPLPFFISAFMWIAFSLANMAVAPDLQLSPVISWLTLGIGIILLLRGVYLVLNMFR
ncbi:MAG: hypothetical protein QXL54_03220 [Candidatus Bathyarchaeia archaeon]